MEQTDGIGRESPNGDSEFILRRRLVVQEVSLTPEQIALADDVTLLAVSVAVDLGWDSEALDDLALNAVRLVGGVPLISPHPVVNLLNACLRRCQEPLSERWTEERIAAEFPSEEMRVAFRRVQLVWQPVGTA